MALSYAKRAERYARAVVDGKVKTGPLARAACQRHLSDLERAAAKDYPYAFDEKRGSRICEFAERMVHIKGKWAKSADGSLPFIKLEDWQCFLLAVAFGWVRKSDQLRRFRELYAEIPRKNSKSTMGAIIGLFMLVADDEAGAEIFAGATSMEQALAVFKPAWLMVHRNPEFMEHFGLELGGTEKNPGPIVQLSTGSRFAPIIGKPGDGDSPSCAIIDEYHEHATSVMYDAMKTGMGSRTQPMRVVITTAGVDTSGPCYDKHLDAEKVLTGALEDDELFTVVFAADPEKPWDNFEETWIPANPNYGVSVFEDYLRSQLRDALTKPSQQNINRTKHTNTWLTAGIAWMNMAKWSACARPELTLESCAGRRVWLGLDLANKIDIASLAYLIELPDGKTGFLCRHYLPEETIELEQNAHYRKWRDAGWIIQTDGARTDFLRVEADIQDASKQFSVQELAYDQREASYLIKSIEHWASFACFEINQSPAQLSEPMKEMEGRIYSGDIVHANDPVLNWMMANTVKKQGRGGGPIKTYYPTKDRDANKIDGVVAGIMGLGRKMLTPPEPDYQVFFVG